MKWSHPGLHCERSHTAGRPLVAPSTIPHVICPPSRATNSEHHPTIRPADVMFLLRGLGRGPATESFISCFTIPQVSPLCCTRVQDRPPRDHCHLLSLPFGLTVSGRVITPTIDSSGKFWGNRKGRSPRLWRQGNNFNLCTSYIFSSRRPLMDEFVCIPPRRNVVIPPG